MDLVVPPPERPPWYLLPFLWLARRITGKDPLPGRLLTHFPKAALGAGVFEALAAHGPRDLDRRTLAVARLAASATAGCPFCSDMNAAAGLAAGLSFDELDPLLAGRDPVGLTPREELAARYARALSMTPVALDAGLVEALRGTFTPREVVVLASCIAQVNYWTRLNQGLGVPAAGFLDAASACQIPVRARPSGNRRED